MSDEQQDLEQQAAQVLDEVVHALEFETDIRVRSMSEREIDVRLAPFDTPIQTIDGTEIIERGAFRSATPSRVLLMGLEHEVHIGFGQDGRPKPVRRPAGKATRIWEDEKYAYATFRVARTASGDEILALADDGIVTGVSVEMGKKARFRSQYQNGRRVNFCEDADLLAASPTYQPAYQDARVLAVRSAEEDAPVATEEKAPAAGATATEEKPEEQPAQYRTSFDPAAALSNFESGLNKITEVFGERLERLEERARSSFEIPGTPKETPKASLGTWMDAALRLLTGERIADAQYRTVQDLITTDNAGIVPDAYVDRLIGRIDARRPFMASTERLPVPESGMNLVVPKITQRPTVAEQTVQKTELSSQKTIIGTESFPVHTYGGVGDISIQLLKRSDPSFLELYLRLLAEAYAIETEDAAVSALITAVNDGGPEPAVALDPEDLNLGAAFEAAFASMRLAPDTIWLSSAAVSAFIDAKSDGTNTPLYSNLGAAFTAGGQSGPISGLRPIHVPALDDKGAYAIAGRSDGFAWAEDGTYTLQVDVPSKAGRDVALVGMVWFVPWYPEAFTLFNVAS